MSERPYSETHAHPTGLSIPPVDQDEIRAEVANAVPTDGTYDPEFPIQRNPGQPLEDDENPALSPSGARPPPSKGILKNPLKNTTDPNKERCVGLDNSTLTAGYTGTRRTLRSLRSRRTR